MARTEIKRRTGASRPATVPTMFGSALHNMLAVVYLTSLSVSGTDIKLILPACRSESDTFHAFFGTIFRNPLVAIATTTPILTEPFEPDPEADARFNEASEFVYDSVVHFQRTRTVPSYFDADAREHLSSLSPKYFSPDWNDRIDQVDVFFAYRNLLDFTLKRFSLDDNSIDFTLQSVVHCNQCGYTERLDQRISKLVMTESISNPSKFFDCEYVVPNQSNCQRCESTGQSYCVGRLDGSPAMLFVKIPKDRNKTDYQIEPSFELYGSEKYVLRTIIVDYEDAKEGVADLFAGAFTFKRRDGTEGQISTMITSVLSGEGLINPQEALKVLQCEYLSLRPSKPRLLIYVRELYVPNLPPTIRLPSFRMKALPVMKQYFKQDDLEKKLPARVQMVYEAEDDVAKAIIRIPSDDETNAAMITLMPFLHCLLSVVPEMPIDVDNFLSRVLYALRNRLSIDPVDLFNVFAESSAAGQGISPLIQELFNLLPRADRDVAGATGQIVYALECRCCRSAFYTIPVSAAVFGGADFSNPSIVDSFVGRLHQIRWQSSCQFLMTKTCERCTLPGQPIWYRYIISLPKRCFIIDIGVNRNPELSRLHRQDPAPKEIIPYELTEMDNTQDNEPPMQTECKTTVPLDETENKKKRSEEMSLIRVEDQKYDKLAAFMLQTETGDLVPYLQSGKGKWYTMAAPGSINLVPVTKDEVKSLLSGQNVPGGPRYLFYCNQDNPDSPVNRNSN